MRVRSAASRTGSEPQAITAGQLAEFEGMGYLVIPDALAPAQVDHLTEAVDRIYAERARDLARVAPLHLKGFVTLDDRFLELLDHRAVFPKVVELLGWNIFLYHCHLDVNPPLAVSPPPRWGWHQDGGRINGDLESRPRPRVSIKVAYFLSDLSFPDRGNLHVLPGSHVLDTLARPSNGRSAPAGAVPVLGLPGTAVLFDRRLWHARGDNTSTVTRKVLFLAYTYRWVRPRDDFEIPSRMMEGLDPVRRQLLGTGTSAMGHFVPTPEDVPVRAMEWAEGSG